MTAGARTRRPAVLRPPRTDGIDMQESATRTAPAGETFSESRRFPAVDTAIVLDRQLGLYLSSGQQRGLAIALLVGTAALGALLGSAVVAAVQD
jgi:hypothetical protein